MSVIKITESKRIDLPKMTVSDDVFQEFKSTLNSYIKKIRNAVSNNENEEHIKNIINDFLRMTFYNDKKYSINTDGNIDSAIKESGKLLAIIEAKSPMNKNEMVTVENMNKKALWEAIYYFLEKTIDVSKSKAMISMKAEVRRLIITDGFNWFLIDSVSAHAVTDGIIERRFWEYKNGKRPYKNDTAAFYEELSQHFDNMNITDKLDYIYFNVEECISKKQSIVNLYKILSESFLLKNTVQNYNYEPHSLNSGFYHELLYIMGLKETLKDNKLVVEIDPTIKNSLSNQVYYLLKDKEIEDDKINELAFELVLIWVNRLLFIKLFEGQLMSFNETSENYRILSHDKIESFDDLQGLFFDVLGTKERTDTDFHNKFSNIPYLNSSLFEKQKIETDYILIRFLRNENITRKSSSVLGKKSKSTLPILEYIIDFLNNYNFSSNADNGSYNSKEIIDAAVLGLIFEKLNGYKDGANYTPSVITEYIAKEAIETAVINAVNSEMKWKCGSLADINDKIESREERIKINEIINSLKICDPAVGSGHFLVSALNRIIAIKKQLGVLFKYNSNERIKEYDIVVENDVLIVRDGNGNPFVYNKKNNESREIQETLFNEKRIIIENCLFGVDINSKAVYICQLRLWIELLKNAYYKNGVMETLPNIDINIKVGSSPLSKIDFIIGKKIKTDKDTGKLIQDYKTLVSQYKSVSDKIKKKELQKKLFETKEQVHGLYEQFSFFKEHDTTYDCAFEWAFEFPEILDENGKFIGFDAVIGNPPYIQLQTMHEEADKLQKMSYQTYARTGDIYCLFYELAYRLLKTDGILAFVTSNKWMRAGYGEALRKFLCEKTNPTHLIDFAGQKVFDSATVDVNILIYRKSKNQHKTLSCVIKDADWRNNLSDYFQQNAEENRFDNFAS
ncbi:MAG: Eco57I restriction-modification methylase domain-containing protein, partial [Ruminococcus sp.]|nr:Eco57I restriction-modification methylase domain-containing protein [Ruminococcus sp.]